MSQIYSFPRDTHLSLIAQAYRNPDTALIADLVLPRVPVDKKEFSYQTYPEADMYTIPDTRIGERSQMTSGTVSGKEVQSKCFDEGHQIALTADEVSQTKSTFNPKERATNKCANITVLGREKRCAELVFNEDSFGTGLKRTLDGTGGKKYWSDKVDGTPLDDLLAALDAPLMRPNLVVFGQTAWSKVRRHPQLVKAVGSTTGEGVISTAQLAELLEVNEVLVGASRANTVKEGKTPVLANLWGPHCALLYRDRTVDTAGGVTFGYTAEFEKRQAGWGKVDIGARGGEAVRVFETVRELVIASKAGYFVKNCVSV